MVPLCIGSAFLTCCELASSSSCFLPPTLSPFHLPYRPLSSPSVLPPLLSLCPATSPPFPSVRLSSAPLSLKFSLSTPSLRAPQAATAAVHLLNVLEESYSSSQDLAEAYGASLESVCVILNYIMHPSPYLRRTFIYLTCFAGETVFFAM